MLVHVEVRSWGGFLSHSFTYTRRQSLSLGPRTFQLASLASQLVLGILSPSFMYWDTGLLSCSPGLACILRIRILVLYLLSHLLSAMIFFKECGYPHIQHPSSGHL